MNASSDPVPAWPTAPEALADPHRCPVCFTAVTPGRCRTCGFDFAHPGALGVLEVGRDIARLEVERRRRIGVVFASKRIEDAAAARAAARTAAREAAREAARASHHEPTRAPVSAAPPAAVATPATADAASPAVARALAALAAPAPSSAAHPPRRRLTVPVLLLIVGVSLVGVAAVFFLVFAWFVWGVAVRALIVGAITLASIASASLLRRRALTATAEGIGALGIVLLALDAWAVRANDFFGAAGVDAATYAGAAALVVGAACRAWARLSRLRAPDLAAALALPVGIGLLLAGVLSLPPAETAVAGLLGASAGGLLHALPAPVSSARSGRDAWPERLTLAIVGVSALVAAAVTTAVATGSALPVVVWASALTVLLGVAHAMLVGPRRDAEPLPGAQILGGAASSVAVAAAGLAGWQLALRDPQPLLSIVVAPVLAVATAAAVDRLRARRGGLTPAWMTAAIVAVVSIGTVAVGWCVQAIAAIAASWSLWTTAPLTAPPAWVDAPYLALLSAALLVAGLFLAPTLTRGPLHDARAVTAAVLVLGAAARPATPALVVGVAVAVAAASVFALRRSTARVGLLTTAALGTVVVYAAGLSAPVLWVVGVVVAVALPIVLLVVLRDTGAVASGLVVAAVGAASVSALVAPSAIAAATGVPGPQWQVSVSLLQWIALAALIAAATVRVDRAARTTLAWAGMGITGLTLLWTAVGHAVAVPAGSTGLRGVIGDPAAAIVRGAGLVAVCAFVALRRTRVGGKAATAAAALVAPTLAYALHEILGAVGVRDLGAVPLVPLAGAVAVVGGAAWLALTRGDAAELRLSRLAADLGALATALVVVWPIGAAHVWAAWALAAVGIGLAAACVGWAAPAGDPVDDVFATGSEGLPWRAAPRRLLVWPAAGAAILAWWSLLGAGTPATAFTVEAEAVPAGALLVAFAGPLVWLRRRGEASVALGTGLALALWVPAVEGWSGTPVRGAVTAVAAAVLCLALSWSPLRRVDTVAPVGAVVSLIALGLVAVHRTGFGEPVDTLWLAALVGVAYLSGWGMARDDGARALHLAYATAVPAIALAVSCVGALGRADDPRVVGAALAAVLALHVAAAAVSRRPLTWLTRWTAYAGAVLLAATALAAGAVREIELVSLPLAAGLLAAAAAGALRHRAARGAAREAAVWIAGLVLATAPSIVAPVTPARTWSVIAACLLVAGAAAWVRVPETWRVRVPTVLVLVGAAVAMGARALVGLSSTAGDSAALSAGAGAVAVAIVLVARGRDGSAGWPPVALAAMGAGLLAGLVIARSDGGPLATAVTALVAGTVGVTAASALALDRWRGVAAVLAVGGLVVTASAIGIRFVLVVDEPGLEADLWVLVGAGLSGAIALAAMRARPTTATLRAGSVALSAIVGLSALAESALQVRAATSPELVIDVRAMGVMTLLTVATALCTAMRGRLGVAPALTAAISAAVFGAVTLIVAGAAPVELVAVPAAVGGIVYGARTLARDPRTRTWPALGPWLALLTVPSLVRDLDAPGLPRVVLLGVVAVAMVAAGAVLRLQAPLVVGSAVLLVHATAQLWPWIRDAYVAVPWWLWLGIGGAVLIFLAATYERRMRQMKTALTAVVSLR